MSAQHNNGITDLMVAASRGDQARVEELLAQGADPNAHDVFGQTALMYAASAGHAAVVEELVDAGADVETRNRNHKSSHELARERGHAAVATFLRNASLFTAARDGELGRLNALLDAGVDPNALLRNEWTALMIAALNDRPQAVAALLRRGAYPDTQNATGWTALMIAERKGHAEVAHLLRAGSPERPLPSLIAEAVGEADLSAPPEQTPERPHEV
jgi:uncharacterized protein